jgi:murein DD-endopeptidase MepM/ murein hydrolase activator NlpD
MQIKKRDHLRMSLVVQINEGTRLVHNLQDGITTIGATSQNDIVVNDPSVSGSHARFIVTPKQVLIEDLGSGSGTWIGNERILPNEPALIKSGSIIHLGEVKVTLSKPKKNIIPRLLAILATIILLIVVLFLLWPHFQNKTAYICSQPPMKVLTMGGLIYSTDGLQILNKISPAATEIVLPTVTTSVAVPTMAVSSAPLPTIPVIPAATNAIQSTPFPIVTITSSAPLASEQPILSSAFLELPFPYQGCEPVFGGSDEQFRKVSQLSSEGGRLNSWFDHFLPIYGREKEDPALENNVLLFSGALFPDDSGYYYSGHPAYDYSTCEWGKSNTPVFAASDGVISKVDSDCGLYVKIKHNVPSIGFFQTTYLHLKDDEYYAETKSRAGQAITRGTRIGTMDNTGADEGCSTGAHLHFEVRYDQNQDGIFSSSEVIDPYGYIPSSAYPNDPWNSSSSIARYYLWAHPLGLTAEIPEDGAGQLGNAGDPNAIGGGIAIKNSLCAEPGTLPPGGWVYWSWSPDPEGNDALAPIGDGCALSVFDSQANPLDRFDQPVKIAIPYQDADLSNVNADSLVIYWLEPGSDSWKPLPTTLDPENHLAITTTDRPGHCTLLGIPTHDIVSPHTRINVSGSNGENGAWYGQVTVDLASEDASGIDRVEYSLDRGNTWQTYSGPFILPGSGAPTPVPTDPDAQERFFGGYLVMASAIDRVGNREYPPAERQIVIIPLPITSSPPVDQTVTYTPTPTISATPTPTASSTLTPTITPTSTGAVCNPIAILQKNAFCRSGPGTAYKDLTSLNAGQTVSIVGRSIDTTNLWWLIQYPGIELHCWISDSTVTTQGDTSCVPGIYAPPPPIPTLTSSPTSIVTYVPVYPTDTPYFIIPTYIVTVFVTITPTPWELGIMP